MTRIISFDMDGTLIAGEFTDGVWKQGIPALYAAKEGISFEAAKSFVEAEYDKVGEGAIEWYDIKYWLQFFELNKDWRTLLGQYADKIRVYPDANPILSRLKEEHRLILTSNAGREFLEVELNTTGLGRYFSQIFSATSDFGEVKKTTHVYDRICRMLGVTPEEIIHVGDHYEFDYLVPRSIGIQAFFLDRSGQRNGDSFLRSLEDLEKELRTEGSDRGRSW